MFIHDGFDIILKSEINSKRINLKKGFYTPLDLIFLSLHEKEE